MTVPALSFPLAIVLVNESTVLKDADVAACAAALDTQANQHFAPYWGIGAHVTAAKAVPQGSLGLHLLDDSDQAGALGYHDDDPKLGIYGRVFAKTDQHY